MARWSGGRAHSLSNWQDGYGCHLMWAFVLTLYCKFQPTGRGQFGGEVPARWSWASSPWCCFQVWAYKVSCIGAAELAKLLYPCLKWFANKECALLSYYGALPTGVITCSPQSVLSPVKHMDLAWKRKQLPSPEFTGMFPQTGRPASVTVMFLAGFWRQKKSNSDRTERWLERPTDRERQRQRLKEKTKEQEIEAKMLVLCPSSSQISARAMGSLQSSLDW